MRPVRIALAVVAAAVVLSACSASPAPAAAPSSSVAAVAPSDPAPEPATSSASPAESLESVAAKIGVQDFARSSTAAPATLAWGQGTLDGSRVQIYEFADDAGYQSFLQSVAGYGVTESSLVRSGNFAVAPTDKSQIESIRSELG